MSTDVLLVREDDPTAELGSARQVAEGLVVAEASPGLACLDRACVVFADGTTIAGDIQRHPERSPLLIGIELDQPGPVVEIDPAIPLPPAGPDDFARSDDPAVAEMRGLVQRVLGRSALVVSVEEDPASELLFPQAAAAVLGGAAPLAAAGRIRSPFCWLFPRSRFCR